jgi:hypothetical protein
MKRVKITYTIVDYFPIMDNDEQTAMEMAERISSQRSLNEMEEVDRVVEIVES